MSDKKATLHEQLNYIQTNLKAPKGQKNTFGNYNYRSCEDILEGVKPLLGQCVLSLSDEITLVGDRYYVKAIATLSLDDKCIKVSAYAREPESKKGMDLAQLTGATSSYARKYALNGLFCIDDTKDADTMDNSKVEATTPPSEKVQAANLMAKKGFTPEEAKKFLGTNFQRAKLAELSPDEIKRCIATLKEQA